MGQRVLDKAYFYAKRSNRKRLRQLLRKHPYLRTSDDSFLLFAAIWHDRSMLPWLLDHGVHPDCRLGRGDNTALMQAASENDLETMRLLLRYGADPNSRNEANETPLGFACAWKQWAAAGLLLDNGADVNAIESSGETFLDWATIAGDNEGIDLLRSRGGTHYSNLYPNNAT